MEVDRLRFLPDLSASANAHGCTVSTHVGVTDRFKQEGKFPKTGSANDESSRANKRCHEVGILGDHEQYRSPLPVTLEIPAIDLRLPVMGADVSV